MSFRCVVLSDTHFTLSTAVRESTWWNRTTERSSARMAEALDVLVKRLAPDFIVHCGDVTADDTAESWDFSCEVMARTGRPWFAVPGNHDTMLGCGRDMLRNLFDPGDGRWSFSRVLGGVRFVFLDVVHWFDADGACSPYLDRERYANGAITGMGPTESDILWFEKTLRGAREPVVVVTHAPIHFRDAYPLETFPYGKPAEAPMTAPDGFISGFLRPDEGREAILDIVRKNGNVIACFAGHWHINDAVVSDGVLFMMTCSLREYPFEIRLVEFDGAVIHGWTYELDVPELRERSYVGEWGNDWVRGRYEDREFRIPARFTL